MDNPRQYQLPTTMEPWDGDELTREPLLPEPRVPRSFPRSIGTLMLLGALALLLVVTILGSTIIKY